MIEQLPQFPPEVLAFVGKGRITGRDYRETLVPAVEKALKGPSQLRLYYEFDPDFAGFDAEAMWEDFKLGVEHPTRWERIAVVTDVDWIAQAVRAFGFLMPAKVKSFRLADTEAGRRWVVEQA